MAVPPGQAGQQPVQEQGGITCTFVVDVDSINDQRETDERATPWYVPEARSVDETYAIQQYDVLCKVDDCGGTYEYAPRRNKNVNTKLISALNGLRVPREINALLNKLQQYQNTEDMRRHILNMYVKFKGASVERFSYKSNFGANNVDLNRSMYVTGVTQQPVRLGQSFSVGDPVRFVVPVEEDIRKQNFFTRYDGRRHQHGKIMMYLTRVDPMNSYKLMRSNVREYLRDSDGLKSILQQCSESEKKIMPAFSMPEYLQRVLHTAMIMGQYLGIRAGVLQVRGVRGLLGDRYQSSLVSQSPGQTGYSYYNYSDALHFVANGARSQSFPTPNDTRNDAVRVFGNPVSAARNVTDDDAAYEYLILALQMGNLMLEQDPPIGPDSQYGSEGFFSTVRDPNKVKERASSRFRALLNEGCRNMAANLFTAEDYAESVVGYDPRTGINPKVFKVGRDGYIDKNRDAGVAACAVAQSLPSYLRVVANAAHEMTASHGVVIAGGKEVVNVFIGRGAV